MQAHWRAYQCRVKLKEEWTRQLHAVLAGAGSQPGSRQMEPSTLLLSLMWRVYDPSALQQLPLMAAVCRIVLGSKGPDGKLLFTSCSGEDQGRQLVHARALSVKILLTIRIHRCAQPFKEFPGILLEHKQPLSTGTNTLRPSAAREFCTLL